MEQTNDKTTTETDSGSASAFKPSISIRRRRTRRYIAQVDEQIADLADEYVQFVSECCGYEVSPGDIMNEIYKSHFARDGGFKGWRASRRNGAPSSARNPKPFSPAPPKRQ